MKDFFKLGTRYSVLGTRYSVLVLLFLNVTFLKAQNDCGTPDLPWPEYEALRAGMGVMPSGGPLSANLPIWFTVVPGNGQFTDYKHNWDYLFAPQQLIQQLNGYFSPVDIQFYLCGVTVLSNANYVDLTYAEMPGLRDEAQIINPNYEEVINVYLVSSLPDEQAGYAGMPGITHPGSIFLSSQQNATTLAHEMGHYLSMPHTYAWGHAPPAADALSHPEWAQYVNNTVTLLVNGQPMGFTCLQTGDGFCDTPADINGWNNNAETCSYYDDCSQFLGCPYNDPLGVPYSPDMGFLMGNYGCRYKFSDDQIEQMREMLFTHANWAFLIDTEQPTCQTFGTSADHGMIKRICVNGQGSISMNPLNNVIVPFMDVLEHSCGIVTRTNNNGHYITYHCVQPYLGTGLLSVLPQQEAPTPMDAVLDGVTTLDLVKISKHILGIEALPSPFQLIAADANNSGSITTFDIVEIRKLILRIYDELPNNRSWRFVPESCLNDPAFSEAFYDPGNGGANPFDAEWTNPEEGSSASVRNYGSGPLPEAPNNTSWMDHINLDPNGLAAQDPLNWSFVGVKIGDVNCSGSTTLEPPQEPDGIFISTPHSLLNTNQLFTVQLKVLGSTPITAWQLGVDFAEDSLQILSVQEGNSGESFSLDNFGLTGLSTGKFTALNFWPDGASKNLNNLTLFKLNMKALKPVSNLAGHFQLKSSVLPLKFYDADGEELTDITLKLEVLTNGIGMQANTGGALPKGPISQVFAYPSPFLSIIQFDAELMNDEMVEIVVYDSRGGLVSESNLCGVKGANHFTIEMPEYLPSGLYAYALKAGGYRQFGKLVK